VDVLRGLRLLSACVCRRCCDVQSGLVQQQQSFASEWRTEHHPGLAGSWAAQPVLLTALPCMLTDCWSLRAAGVSCIHFTLQCAVAEHSMRLLLWLCGCSLH
jgi:hypothetical protein